MTISNQTETAIDIVNRVRAIATLDAAVAHCAAFSTDDLRKQHALVQDLFERASSVYLKSDCENVAHAINLALHGKLDPHGHPRDAKLAALFERARKDGRQTLNQIEQQILTEHDVMEMMLSDADKSDAPEIIETAEKQIDVLFECLDKGHDFSGDGYEGHASTETASDSFCCNRCGFSHEVTYY